MQSLPFPVRLAGIFLAGMAVIWLTRWLGGISVLVALLLWCAVGIGLVHASGRLAWVDRYPWAARILQGFAPRFAIGLAASISRLDPANRWLGQLFVRRIDFPALSTAALQDIFGGLLGEKGLRLAAGADRAVQIQIEERRTQSGDEFDNVHAIRRLVDDVLHSHALRIHSAPASPEQTPPIVSAEDVRNASPGPPGTGKTIMARKIGDLFKAVGLLRKGHVVEVDRSKLTGAHLGAAGQLVREAVKDALDGVLFIDEAYALAGGTGDLASSDLYGNEAIQTLLKMMEDHRERLVVIAAGYPGPMRRFLENNPGLRSRFTREFSFHSYEHEELIAIFKFMTKEGKYLLDPEAEREAEKYIRGLDRKREDFGNARDIRTFFERILPAQAYRIAETPDFESMTNEQLLTITAADIRAVAGW